MKTIFKTALVVAGVATIAFATPVLARGPGGGWGYGLNPNCPRYEQTAEDRAATPPARPGMMMRRMEAADGTWTCPRTGLQVTPPADGTKVPGVCDGTGPWWMNRGKTDTAD